MKKNGWFPLLLFVICLIITHCSKSLSQNQDLGIDPTSRKQIREETAIRQTEIASLTITINNVVASLTISISREQIITGTSTNTINLVALSLNGISTTNLYIHGNYQEDFTILSSDSLQLGGIVPTGTSILVEKFN